MAYNRKNKLKLIIDIQAIYLEHSRKGATGKWIYDNLIRPVYRISERTFYNYLSTNARKELKELREVECRQKSLF